MSDVSPRCNPQRGAWEETPGAAGRGGETPGATPSARVWDATPGHLTPGQATPGRETPAQHASRRNRWDETPKTDRGLLHWLYYLLVMSIPLQKVQYPQILSYRVYTSILCLLF